MRDLLDMHGDDPTIPDEQAVTLRVTGRPDMRPSLVPTVDFLRLAHRYYDLLQKASGSPLTFTGIDIRASSVSCLARPSSIESARQAQYDLAQRVAGTDGDDELAGLSEFRQSMRRLPESALVIARVGNDDAVQLGVGEGTRSIAVKDHAESLLSLRCKVMQASYERAVVHLKHVFDNQRLCLKTDLPTLRALSTFGGQEVDVTAWVEVDATGLFKSLRGPATNGRLESFRPLVPGDAIEAWRRWYAENRAEVKAWLQDE